MAQVARLLALSTGTFASLVLLIWVAAGTTGFEAGSATASAAQEAREVTALVGGGQDTNQLLAFFPMNLRVRQGDTVTWRIAGDELHTVSFTAGTNTAPAAGGIQFPLGVPGEIIPGFAVPVPGGGPTDFMLHPQMAFPTRAPGAPVERYSGSGFFNSGILSKQSDAPGEPPNDRFSLTFDTPGTYPFLCLIHSDRMLGTVQVVSRDAEAPDQATIDAQANAEMAPLLALLNQARAQGQVARSEPGPGGTTLWFVRAGSSDLLSGDARAHVMDFLPKDITVRPGDTVIWGSTYFHTVTFVPSPPLPPFVIPRPQPNGPPFLVLNPQVILPAKPAAIFDPARYFNSADIGPFSVGGFSWALTFERPGTFEYVCLFHGDLGMKGTITVQPR